MMKSLVLLIDETLGDDLLTFALSRVIEPIAAVRREFFGQRISPWK